MREVSAYISISAFWPMRDSIALLHPLAIGLAGRVAAGLGIGLSGTYGAAGLQRGAASFAPAAAIGATGCRCRWPLAPGIGAAGAGAGRWGPLGVRCPVSENRLELFSSFWAMYPLSP